MLVEFKFQNFRSFKNETILSMEPLTQNGNNINCISTSLKKVPELYRTAAVFGANASGKSNLLNAFTFLKLLIRKSYQNEKDDLLHEEAYALDNMSEQAPMIIELSFIEKEKFYTYNIEFNRTTVLKESLFYTPIAQDASARQNCVFDRTNTNGEKTFKKMSGIPQSWSDETLDNRSFLSEIINNRNCQIPAVLDAYDWITKRMRVISNNISGSLTLELIQQGMTENVVRHLKNADLGLTDISVKKVGVEEILQEIISQKGDSAQRNSSQKIMTDLILKRLQSEKAEVFDIKSTHLAEDGSLRTFSFNDMESKGTDIFLKLTGPVIDALDNGGVLIVDELDAALHPYLVKYIVELFNNPEINKNNAQLVFASHAHYLMDGEHLSRDQIWFVSKERSGGFYSDLYSLSDFKIENRKNKSFYDAYMTGIYGAVPFVEMR